MLPAEISAAAVLVSYWTPASDPGSTCTTGVCNNAMWVGLMLIVVSQSVVACPTMETWTDWSCDCLGSCYQLCGHPCIWRDGVLVLQFVQDPSSLARASLTIALAGIKVITVIGLIITGVVITAGGGPDGEAIGFRFWNQTGGFVQYAGIPGAKGRFLGFFSVLISAAFAFIGTEITAIAAAEAADPRRTVPKAIRTVWVRLILFYIASAFVIGLLVSPSDPSLDLESTAAKSPFVIAIKNAGISVLPSIINAALLTSAWSAGCADLFMSSRALFALTRT